MGFLINLPKESNHMYTDYPSAYWYLDNIRTIYEDGVQKVFYDVSAYPSREVKNKEGYWLVSAYPFGDPTNSRVNACLYRFTDKHPTSEVFLNGMPSDLTEVKKILYAHFKNFLESMEIPYIDVLEDEDIATSPMEDATGSEPVEDVFEDDNIEEIVE